MDVRIDPRSLSGAVTPPGSKSMAHRLLLCAALSAGESSISRVSFSQDLEATLRCMEALGARWTRQGEDGVRVTGIGGTRSARHGALPHFDCGESGSTLRFLLPVALAVSGGGVFTGQGRLMERPQQPYLNLFQEKGIAVSRQDGTLTVQGRLTPGEYSLPGDVSSQFFTGLLFALPLLDGPSTVVSSTPLESADYLSMTLQAQMRFGVSTQADWPRRRFLISPAVYRPFDAAVEADWSQAAFWYASKFAGSLVDVLGLDPLSAQGDRCISELFHRLHRPGDVEIDLSPCPDLLPPLAVMAAMRSGQTRFINAARLRLKESDRLQTTCALLGALGGTAREGPNWLEVTGGPLSGGIVDGAGDHRIVMAAAIAAMRCSHPVTILGAEAVRKSYPSFFEEYQRLGGIVHVL